MPEIQIKESTLDTINNSVKWLNSKRFKKILYARIPALEL